MIAAFRSLGSGTCLALAIMGCSGGSKPPPELLSPQLANEPGVYPPPEVPAKMAPERVNSEQFMRSLTRTWTHFKTGS